MLSNIDYAKMRVALSTTATELTAWSMVVMHHLQQQAQKLEKFFCNCTLSEFEQLKAKAMDLTGRRIEPLRDGESLKDDYVPEDHTLYYHIDGDKSCHAISSEVLE